MHGIVTHMHARGSSLIEVTLDTGEVVAVGLLEKQYVRRGQRVRVAEPVAPGQTLWRLAE